ncbi:MAG: hypothetical protein VB118_04250 [Oscillospiraceae bacterium]|nr:hypothetical protein [Oscillospiraceae bacterium]
MKILFVCSQNTCRSPMAQAIATQLYAKSVKAEDKPEFEFDSAGIDTFGASDIAANAKKAIYGLYGIMFAHRPQTLTKELIDKSDLVIAISQRHLLYIKQKFGAGLENESKLTVMPEDIPDPFGMSEEAYLMCAQEIERGIKTLFGKLGILK